MSVVAAAILTSAAVTYVGAEEAADITEQGNKDATALGYAQLDFSREQFELDNERYERDYTRYMDIYGDIEENLGAFYENLTPETLAAAGLQEQAQTFAKAKEQITTNLAQRRIEGSGLEASIMSQAELKNAETKAKIRADAPIQVAQLQQGFVQGKGAQPQPPSEANVLNSMQNLQSTIQSNANREAQTTASLYNSAGSLLSTGLQLYSSGATASGGNTVRDTDYISSPSINPSTGKEWGA